MDWERARSDEQKEERILSILNSAWDVFKKEGFEKVTFAKIAQGTGGARSNIYKYFTTREEVFLELLRREIGDWRIAAERLTEQGPLDVSCFAQEWVETILSRPRLTALIGLMYAVLEKNVSSEALVCFKESLAKDSRAIAQAFVRANRLPNEENALQFVISQFSLTVGTTPLFHLSSAQRHAMAVVQLPESSDFHRQLFQESLIRLLHPNTV